MTLVANNPMTPAESRAWLMSLPVELRATAQAALFGAWQDGNGVGNARLPSLNPFATVPPTPIALTDSITGSQSRKMAKR